MQCDFPYYYCLVCLLSLISFPVNCKHIKYSFQLCLSENLKCLFCFAYHCSIIVSTEVGVLRVVMEILAIFGPSWCGAGLTATVSCCFFVTATVDCRYGCAGQD
ncbi:hypothetical protein E2C01_087554 [Portunus trituberculatus]|uniref:Uncharacterized protein n=1 Tax=Portunus trituberculatus TaxID=210409 RepID=A0A5B7JDP1_PORTR|nr:hypothetical protein [Portunus trituberculatus]